MYKFIHKIQLGSILNKPIKCIKILNLPPNNMYNLYMKGISIESKLIDKYQIFDFSIPDTKLKIIMDDTSKNSYLTDEQKKQYLCCNKCVDVYISAHPNSGFIFNTGNENTIDELIFEIDTLNNSGDPTRIIETLKLE